MARSKVFVADWSAVFTSAMLAITVGVIHVLDQGGITKYAGSPWWLGWGYRLVEIGSVVIAVALVAGRRLIVTWLAAFSIGFGPFIMFLLTRLVGLPGDAGDFGNWGDPLGTASLLVEGTLMLMAAAVVIRLLRADRDEPAYSVTARDARPGGGAGIPLSA